MRSIQQIFNVLQQRAALNLTDEDLEVMAGATSFAKSMAIESRDVLMAVGCLANADEGNTGSLSSGGDDVPSLLFHTANTFDLIFSLIEIGENARYELDMRKSAPVRIESQGVRK